MFVSLHQQNPPRFPMNSEPGRNFYFILYQDAKKLYETSDFYLGTDLHIEKTRSYHRRHLIRRKDIKRNKLLSFRCVFAPYGE